MNGQLWIEITDSEGAECSVRWGSPVTDEQIDAITEFATEVIGREPDTIAP